MNLEKPKKLIEKFDNDYHIELFNKANAGDLSARWELVLAVTPLVQSKMKKFQSNWVRKEDMNDFTHTTYEILYHAVEKWKPELSKWSFYCQKWSYEICARFARQRIIVRHDEKRGKVPQTSYFDSLENIDKSDILKTEVSHSIIQLKELLNNSILDDRESYVIEYYFFKEKSFQSIAADLKCSRQRTIQIYEKAIKKIRKSNHIEMS